MLQRNIEAVPATPPPERANGVNRSQSIDPREIFRILRRQSRIIVLSTLVLLLLATVFVMSVTPLFTATSTVFIDPRRSNVGEPSGQVLSNFNTDDSTIESQVLLIQSVAVLQRVVESLKLTDDPEFAPQPGWLDRVKRLFGKDDAAAITRREAAIKSQAVENLQRSLKVVRQRTTFLVDISASSRDPAKAATIANAIAEGYFTEQVRSKYDTAKIAGGWLGKQIEDLKARVQTSDKAVQDFRTANNLVASQGVTLNDQQITDLNNRLVEARVQTAEARAKYDQVAQIAKSGRDPGSVAEALSSDIISRLRTQYADLAKNEAELSTKYGSRHPQVGTIRAQLRDTQKLIDEEVQRILQGRRQLYEVAAAREDSLRKSLDALQGVSNDSSQAQVKLRELQREADANRTLYESFLARYKETSAQESLEMPESRVVTRAGVPIRPSFPKTMLTLGLAILLGLGLGSVLALIADYLDRRIKSLDQAQSVSGLPSLAAIPAIGLRELARLAKRGRDELKHYDAKTARLLPTPLQPPLMRYAIEEPTSTFAEAVRAIRLAVLRVARTKATQVVMVTSAIDSEGKTTLAANLAFSFASMGVRTILVEGDLRNPEMSRSLCPHARFGLLQAAMGETPLHHAIVVEPTTGLAVLPSPFPANAALMAEFVPSEGMEAILTELRQHFDMIVVDAPPLLPVVDARTMAEGADSILLAIGWDRTPQDVVVRALDLIAPVQDRLIGTVLTRVDLNRQRFYESYDSASYAIPYGYGTRPNQEVART